MEIRHSKENDLDTIMKIFAHARQFMAKTGNPWQWGKDNWPPEELIRQDIKANKSYVCIEQGEIVGTFFFDYGERVEPSYQVITNGDWIQDTPYGVIHRIASLHTVKGIGSYCINWAFEQAGHLRIDTYKDNQVMQSFLTKLGFEYCGWIYLKKDNEPRLAYEKVK